MDIQQLGRNAKHFFTIKKWQLADFDHFCIFYISMSNSVVSINCHNHGYRIAIHKKLFLMK